MLLFKRHWHTEALNFVQNDSDCFKNFKESLNLSCKFLYISSYDHEATNMKLLDEKDEDKTSFFLHLRYKKRDWSSYTPYSVPQNCDC